jgi:hypothetical protein
VGEQQEICPDIEGKKVVINARRRLRKLVAIGVLCFVSGQVLWGNSAASAHCAGSSTVATGLAGYGREFNLNANTCDNKRDYTGRFDDLSTTFGIRMQWDVEQNGGYEGGSIVTSASATPTSLLWTYTDAADTASWFRISYYNSNSVYVGNLGRGTNSGY